MIRARIGSPPWRTASYAALDFETTGLNLVRDHVLSYGLVPIDRGRIRMREAVYRVIRPPVAIIPAESIRVHGIRPQELADAPELEVVADELIRALEGRTLVAHAKSIELAFLERIYRDRGRRPPRRAIDVLDLAAALADRRDEPQLQSQRLAFVADRFGVPVSRTHHAFDDALVTAQLFLVLATELEGLGMGRLRDLERA